MRSVCLLLCLVSPALAGPDDDALARWAAEQGGSVQRNSDGAIVAADLSHTWITDADLSRLAGLDSLERLDLSETRITDVGMENLAGLRNVRELNLYFAEFVSEFGVANLKSWRKLETLNLRGTMVRGRVLETLAELANLRELDLSHTRITDEGFDQLAELRRLERLSIGSNRLDGGALEALKLLPALKSLDVRGVQRVDSGIWGLALNRANMQRISELTQLEELLLGGATITDVGADRPGREDAERTELPDVELLASLKRLRTLDLSRQPVKTADLGFLRALPELADLNLGQCVNVDDRAAEILAALSKLKTLYLAGSGLTDAGLAQLGKLPLERISLGGVGVSRGAAENYRAAHPDAQVTWFTSEAFARVRRAQ